MKRILIPLCLALLFSVHLSAQESIIISGRIIDKETKQSLSYVQIILLNKQIAILSDSVGQFNSQVFDPIHGDSILFSCLGYEKITCDISDFIDNGERLISLTPKKYELNEVVISARRLDPLKLMKRAVQVYQKERRKDPHIAMGHYREKAKIDGSYVMYTESIGYAVYNGNDHPQAGYSFFCENTRRSDRQEKWLNLARYHLDGKQMSDVSSGNSFSLSRLRRLEQYGPLSKKYYRSYTFRLDSIYFENNQKLYSIHFEKKNQMGHIHIYADDYEIKILNISSKAIRSNRFQMELNQQIIIRFNYFNHEPFIYSVHVYQSGPGIEYWNEYKVLAQRFDDFKLDHGEIWSMIHYSMLPFVEYKPESWITYHIRPDEDYDKIEEQLGSLEKNLQEQYIANSGNWWLQDYQNFWQINDDLYDLQQEMNKASILIESLKKFF